MQWNQIKNKNMQVGQGDILGNLDKELGLLTEGFWNVHKPPSFNFVFAEAQQKNLRNEKAGVLVGGSKVFTSLLSFLRDHHFPCSLVFILFYFIMEFRQIVSVTPSQTRFRKKNPYFPLIDVIVSWWTKLSFSVCWNLCHAQ